MSCGCTKTVAPPPFINNPFLKLMDNFDLNNTPVKLSCSDMTLLNKQKQSYCC